MQKSHCPRCAGYEDKVMRRREGEELHPEVTPCPEFAMSDRFRDWAVSQMQREVGGQIATAGLDRMALLKASKGPKAEPNTQDARPAAARPHTSAEGPRSAEQPEEE